jgi:hypothetical protein
LTVPTMLSRGIAAPSLVVVVSPVITGQHSWVVQNVKSLDVAQVGEELYYSPAGFSYLQTE